MSLPRVSVAVLALLPMAVTKEHLQGVFARLAVVAGVADGAGTVPRFALRDALQTDANVAAVLASSEPAFAAKKRAFAKILGELGADATARISREEWSFYCAYLGAAASMSPAKPSPARPAAGGTATTPQARTSSSARSKSPLRAAEAASSSLESASKPAEMPEKESEPASPARRLP